MMRFFSLLIFSFVTSVYAQSLGDIAESGVSAKLPEQQNSQVAKEKTKKVDIDEIIAKATEGDANAQLALGSYFAKGENGLPKDGAKAIEWLEKSANQKNSPAMSYLGYIYAEGKLVPRDMNKAIQWREAGAECGDASVKWTLGNAYLYGFLVPKNHVKALHWITRSAEAGYIEAIKKLIEIYTKLENKTELAKWNAQYAQVLVSFAEKGDTNAMFDIAEKYMSGKGGLPRHRMRAIYWYRKSADAGNRDAMEKIAKMYLKGQFLPQNTERALQYYEKLAEIDPSYCLKLSSMYAEGKDGFPQDTKKSLQWYAKGAEKGDASMRMYLIWRYWREKDFSNATTQCKKVIAEVEGNIDTLKKATNANVSVQLTMENSKLKVLQKMLSEISAGALAPADLNEYYKTIK